MRSTYSRPAGMSPASAGVRRRGPRYPRRMDLSGTWRAIEADDELRRTFPDPDLDDAAWSDIALPAHWRPPPPFDASDGPLLYRHHFDAPAPAPGRRSWLVLEGIFYEG